MTLYTLVRTDSCTTIFYLSLECLNNETQTLVKALRAPSPALLKTSTLLTTELWLEDFSPQIISASDFQEKRLQRLRQSCLLKIEIIIIVMSDQNMFSYIVEGVLLTTVSTFGLVGNILSIVVLTRSINSGSDNSGLGHGRNQGFNK